jgi:glucose-1-phosphate thymidylyltransferase
MIKYETGIILCSGSATRLKPLSSIINKSMIPVNDKFILDYPINSLKHLGVKNLIIILGDNPLNSQIISYLRSGEHLGMKCRYLFQEKSDGISSAIALVEDLVSDNFVVCLGDNIFQKPINWGGLDEAKHNPFAARIALFKHHDLHRFGVASVRNGKIFKLEEKPKILETNCANYAIAGLYGFTKQFFEMFRKTKPSLRGEWEITDILQQYLNEGLLESSTISGWWRDCGTFSALEETRGLVKTDPVVF